MTVKLTFTQQEHGGKRRICCEIKKFNFACSLLRPGELLCACRTSEPNPELTVVQDDRQFNSLITDPANAYQFYAVRPDAL